MKKILLVVVIVIVTMSLFAQAQITPYGSVRAGWWYEITDEDYVPNPDRMIMDFNLQSNSRFGVNFKSNDLFANAEFGSNGSIRHLWGKQSFGKWSLLIGQTEDATNQLGTQVYGGDIGLRGYGAVYSGRNPMVRFECDKGFYLALIQPYTNNDPARANDAIDAIIPRINFGYNWQHKTVRLLPTFVLQMYDYNKDFGQEGSVMSWLGALTFDYNENKFGTKVHVNYGVNIAEMGYGTGSLRRPVPAQWDIDKNETVDTTQLGVVFTAGWDFTPKFNMNLGVGYVQEENDNIRTFENDLPTEDTFTDSRMAFYLQGVFKCNNLRITPEFGLIDDMENAAGNKRGTKMYFGTQFRLDF